MSVTMREMLEAGCHFGHQTRFWNPQMAPFIFGERNHIHIINLEKTLAFYRHALRFVKHIGSRNGRILFVGTKRAASEIIMAEAMRCGMPYVNHRWLGGMLTNFKTVRQSVKRFQEMEGQIKEGLYDSLSKKEALLHSREVEKLRRSLAGLVNMTRLPSAVFVVDVGHHHIAVTEAAKLGIPVIGVVDTNHSPRGLDYVIPGNDDSARAIRLYARGVADAFLLGRAQANQEAVELISGAAARKEEAESAASAAQG